MVLHANRKTSGVLVSVTNGELYLKDLLADKAGVNYVIPLGDSCGTNKTSMKALIAHIIGENEKSIVVPSFCSLHHLNNSTIWSLAIVMFGELLRTAHYLQGQSMTKVRDPQILKECTVSGENSDVKKDFFQAIELRRQEIGWRQYLELLMGQKGPFSGYDKSKKIDNLVKVAMRLYPNGLPSANDEFKMAYGATKDEYKSFFGALFVRVFPTPSTSTFFHR